MKRYYEIKNNSFTETKQEPSIEKIGEREYLGLADEEVNFLELLCEEGTLGKGSHFPSINYNTKKLSINGKEYTIALLEPGISDNNDSNKISIAKTSDISLDKILSRQQALKPIEINLGNILSVINIYCDKEMLFSMSYGIDQGLSKEQLKVLRNMKITLNVEDDNLIFKVYQDRNSKKEDRKISIDSKELIDTILSDEEETEKYIYKNITEPLLIPYSDVEISQNIVTSHNNRNNKQKIYKDAK